MAPNYTGDTPIPPHVLARAAEVFEDFGAALDWLRTPNGALQGATPLALLGTSEGTAAVLQTLGRIEHGLFS